ncbi:fungal-specific transcription factor domain-containing protein [Aspergillus nidulans var. acristatus]
MLRRSLSRASRNIACRRCHKRKVKCSGGTPCDSCRQASKPVECVYPRKSRLIKVSEQYIEDLVAENQRLQGCTHPPHSSEETTNGPVIAEAPWFVNADALHTPILVAEASDSAFASRFRQAMAQSRHDHLPRVNFPSDEQLLAWSETECPWPTPARARLLVQAALNGLGRCYHIVRRSSTLQELDNVSLGVLSKSKLWALFAIGEMYTTRNSSPDKDFPGIRYFCKATNILRIVSERPSVDMVEIQLLLSVYSLYLNRRHAAYSLAGSAVRLAIIMGLHLNIPESQLSDAGEREHRNRIFWTAYTFDRMWAAKLGYPCAISDDGIEVSLPSSSSGLGDKGALDFPDRDYFVARIGLARISGRIIYSIYGKKAQTSSLSHRVQEVFADLRRWLEELPSSLRSPACSEGDWDPKSRSLHLLSNQLAILATRPILLHVLRVHLETREQSGKETNVPASATALSETCIRCARHSCSMLTDSWTNGSFMVFDFFYTQYLFSAATILAISTLLHGKDRQSDEEQFEVAVSFLVQLRDNGNYAAAEFHKHIEAITGLMHSTKIRLGAQSGAENSTAPQDSAHNSAVDAAITELPSTFTDVTPGTALFDPFLQELLEQPPPDLEFIDSSMYLDDQQGFYWPNG